MAKMKSKKKVTKKVKKSAKKKRQQKGSPKTTPKPPPKIVKLVNMTGKTLIVRDVGGKTLELSPNRSSEEKFSYRDIVHNISLVKLMAERAIKIIVPPKK